MKLRVTLAIAALLAGLLLSACAAPNQGAAAPSPVPPGQGPTVEPTAPILGQGEANPVQTIYIAPELKDCVGVGPMQCMQIATSPEGPWELFYNQIEGFTFEPGYTYELKVRTEQVANPPADGSSLRYSLVELVNKTAAALGAPASDELAGTSWILSMLNGAAPVTSEREATLSFDNEGRLAGSTGCNSYFGGYNVDGSSLKVDQLGSTMMACTDEVMGQERTFFDVLEGAAGYTIAGDTLTITAADGATMVFTKA